MIPPELVNTRRGEKTLLIRRELGEESRGYTNGKVRKKGVTMTYNICGTAGHNKRYHGRMHVIV